MVLDIGFILAGATCFVEYQRDSVFLSGKRKALDTLYPALYVYAEGGRFELPMPFRTFRFSRPVHSTTLPPLLLVVATYYTKIGFAAMSECMRCLL